MHPKESLSLTEVGQEIQIQSQILPFLYIFFYMLLSQRDKKSKIENL